MLTALGHLLARHYRVPGRVLREVPCVCRTRARVQDDATLYIVGRPAEEGTEYGDGDSAAASPKSGGATYRMVKFERTPGGGEVDTSVSSAFSFHDVLRELNSSTRGTWRKVSGNCRCQFACGRAATQVLDATAWLGGLRLLKV